MEYSSNMDVKEVYSEDAELIYVDEKRVKWQVVLYTVMDFLFHKTRLFLKVYESADICNIFCSVVFAR